MGYKTILVHLNDQRWAESVLEPALSLARRFGSHVIGLHAVPCVSPPPLPVPGSGQWLGMELGAQHQEAAAIATIFSRMTANQPFTAEWRTLEVPGFDPGRVVVEHALCADLIVAAQADPDRALSRPLDVPERLAIESGRPVLVVPYAGRYPEIARHAVIAWKPTREAARAVFDALPLLKSAQSVQVLEVNQCRDEGMDLGITAALERHGIKATRRSMEAPDISVGDEILSRLADQGADLLVMGAYGHSRMRELVFGGVTRHIARHMTAPTLWSH